MDIHKVSMVVRGMREILEVNVCESSSGKTYLDCTPRDRERLDHFVGPNYAPGPDDDPEGWDEEGWIEYYVDPLLERVKTVLGYEIGEENVQKLDIDVDEKGFLKVRAR